MESGVIRLCYICQERPGSTKDHVVPLWAYPLIRRATRRNHPALFSKQPCCKLCNQRKGPMPAGLYILNRHDKKAVKRLLSEWSDIAASIRTGAYLALGEEASALLVERIRGAMLSWPTKTIPLPPSVSVVVLSSPAPKLGAVEEVAVAFNSIAVRKGTPRISGADDEAGAMPSLGR
jgi:hypothetical protein